MPLSHLFIHFNSLSSLCKCRFHLSLSKIGPFADLSPTLTVFHLFPQINSTYCNLRGMTEPADLRSADLISLAMGRFDDRCPIANGRTITEQRGRSAGQTGAVFEQFVRLFLPHLCLFLLTTAFVPFVALIMHNVEAQNEHEGQMKVLANIERMRAEFILHFRKKPIILGGDLEAESRAFVERVLRVGWARGREGIPLPPLGGQQNLSVPSSVWTMPNSLLFATSLVSRIGYGHVVPQTSQGKILCQLFALMGCPLFLVLIADIGKAIANLLHFLLEWFAAVPIFVKGRERPAKKSPKTEQETNKCVEDVQQTGSDDTAKKGHLGTGVGERVSALMALAFLVLFCAMTAIVYAHLEAWSWLDCFYFSFISFFVIGFGDFAPSNCSSVLFTICSIVIGMSITTVFVDFVSIEYIRNIHRIEKTTLAKCCGGKHQKKSGRRKPSRRRTSRSGKK